MSDTQPRLILICLGNPGPPYAGNRHNAGHMFADYVAERHGFGAFADVDGVEATAAAGELGGLAALVVKTGVFMNESGQVLAGLIERHGADDVLYAVAHDDLDLNLGTAKGRQKGGHGGHNGIRAIMESADETPVFRVKLGVGSPLKADYESPADFLLADFTPDEREQLEAAFPRAEQVLIGQAKSHAAALAKRDRGKDLRERYVREALDQARAALTDLPGASPYPVFLTRREMARAFSAVTALAKLLRKAARAAREDGALRDRLTAFVPEELRSLLPEQPAGRLFFAVDFHLSDGRLKVVELNCAVGYAHWATLADEVLRPLVGDVAVANDADFASFLYTQGLRPLHDADRGAIAFLRGFNNEDMFNVDEVAGLAGRVAEALRADVPLVHERDLEPRSDGLYLADGRRVDLLYVEENLSEWSVVAPDSPLLSAVRDGLVKTFPSLDTFIYTNKGFLSLLGDPAVRDLLAPDDAESKVLRESLLWSHTLDGHAEPAAYYMLEQGLTLVVKGVLGGGGRGVVILRPDSSSQQTGHILRRRMLDGDSIVQGYFPPGRWSPETDLNFDLRVLCCAHEGDIALGPVYARIFRGAKANFTDPDSGVAPVYVID